MSTATQLPDFLRSIPKSPVLDPGRNLTASEREREAWRNGHHEIARAIEAQSRIELFDSYDDIFGEVATGFPGEDCLNDLLTGLKAVVPRKYHPGITALVEATQSELWQSAEYGLDELNNIARMLEP